MRIGSITPIQVELTNAADEIPNKEAIGLAHALTQAPLLQQASKIGAAEVNPPVIDVQIDLFAFISIYFRL